MTPRAARPVAITGVGIVNGAVVGGAPALAAWLERAATREPSTTGSEGPACTATVDPERLGALIDAGERRRLSRVCQLAVAAGRLALADAGLGVRDLGLFVGTEYGDLRSTMEFVDGFLARGISGLSPLLFPSTVMNTMAAATAIAVQAKASSLTFAVPVVGGELAVARAASAVAAGRLDVVLAGGVDQLDAAVQAIVAGLGVEAGTRGEGAAFVVVESLEVAEERGARMLGEIRGAAWRSMRARPCGVGRAVDGPAIGEAVTAAGVSAGALRWVYRSGSGDTARDAWESRLLETYFDGPGPPSAALALAFGQHAGVGAAAVGAAAWSAWTGRLPRVGARAAIGRPDADVERPGPGPALVHGIARGGTHVVLVVDRGRGAGRPWDPR